jgi:hypothetical protein
MSATSPPAKVEVPKVQQILMADYAQVDFVVVDVVVLDDTIAMDVDITPDFGPAALYANPDWFLWVDWLPPSWRHHNDTAEYALELSNPFSCQLLLPPLLC